MFFKHRKRPNRRTADAPSRAVGTIRMIMLVVTAGFLLMILFNDPFTPMHPVRQADGYGIIETIGRDDFPEGYGLKPLLKSPWMALHPPLVFLAYGGIILLFAASLSSPKRWATYRSRDACLVAKATSDSSRSPRLIPSHWATGPREWVG